MNERSIAEVADRLMAAWDGRALLECITAADPSFDVPAAYAVLRALHARRTARGWRAAGRKIGFTNRGLWSRYGVDRPMWAHVYGNTLLSAEDGSGRVEAARFVQPRIEPEVVFGLRAPVPLSGDARDVLESVHWIAAGFEIVQCHFPDWKFQAADCTACFGLHGGLVVGPALLLDARHRDRLADVLPQFEVVLQREGATVERGRGSNVLDSPALALQHLARLLATQPESPPLAAGEVVTTGTLTDAWPIRPGESWRSDYGALGVAGIELEVD